MKLELPQPRFPEKRIPKKHLLNPCLLWYQSRCWNNKLHGPTLSYAYPWSAHISVVSREERMNYSQLSHPYYYYGIIIPSQWSPEGCLHRTPQLLHPAQISAMAVLGRSAPHLETHSWLHWKNIAWQHLLMKRKRPNSASWPTPVITAIQVWVGGFFPLKQ